MDKFFLTFYIPNIISFIENVNKLKLINQINKIK
jgi:hypothetical protein